MNHGFNPNRTFNKADLAKLPATAKRNARACPNQEICLPTAAKLFYFTRGEMRGFWVRGYSYNGDDAQPYCISAAVDAAIDEMKNNRSAA